MQASAVVVFTSHALIGTFTLWPWCCSLLVGGRPHLGRFHAALGVSVVVLLFAAQFVAAGLRRDRLKMLHLLARSARAAPGAEHMPPHLAEMLP